MLANMAPEYGATAVFFPIDRHALDYMHMTGRSADHIELVEAYNKAQKLWRDEFTPAPTYDVVLTLDLDQARPSISGPSNPDDRIDLDQAAQAFHGHHQRIAGRPANPA